MQRVNKSFAMHILLQPTRCSQNWGTSHRHVFTAWITGFIPSYALSMCFSHAEHTAWHIVGIHIIKCLQNEWTLASFRSGCLALSLHGMKPLAVAFQRRAQLILSPFAMIHVTGAHHVIAGLNSETCFLQQLPFPSYLAVNLCHSERRG